MSYCREEGKDKIIFVSEEDYGNTRKAEVEDDDDEPGLILPTGEINWECPCLGGMATGPCGPEFREAFSCFHYSEADPKGSDCYEPFRVMQECMAKYPSLYDDERDHKKSTENTDNIDTESKDQKQENENSTNEEKQRNDSKDNRQKSGSS